MDPGSTSSRKNPCPGSTTRSYRRQPEMLAALSGLGTDVTAVEVRQYHAGERMGAYGIRAPLGCGGMGDVYEAWDTRLDRTVAIKVLRLCRSGRGADETIRERSACRCAPQPSPHLHAPRRRTRRPRGLPGDGTPGWRHAGSTPGPRAVPWTEAMKLPVQLRRPSTVRTAPVSFTATSRRPTSFLVERSGGSGPPIAKLLDFGLATSRFSDPGEASAPPLGSREATPSKPLTRAGAHSSARSDTWLRSGSIAETWTLAATFSRRAPCSTSRIAGHRPFEHAGDPGEMGAVPEQPLAPLAESQPGTPPVVDRIVSTCLARDPDDRFQTARDLHRALTWARRARRQQQHRQRMARCAGGCSGGARGRPRACRWRCDVVVREHAANRGARDVLGVSARGHEIPTRRSRDGGCARRPATRVRRAFSRRHPPPVDPRVRCDRRARRGGYRQSSYPFWSPDGESLRVLREWHIAQNSCGWRTRSGPVPDRSRGAGWKLESERYDSVQLLRRSTAAGARYRGPAASGHGPGSGAGGSYARVAGHLTGWATLSVLGRTSDPGVPTAMFQGKRARPQPSGC